MDPSHLPRRSARRWTRILTAEKNPAYTRCADASPPGTQPHTQPLLTAASWNPVEDCRSPLKLLRRRPIALFTPLGRLPCPAAPAPAYRPPGAPQAVYIYGALLLDGAGRPKAVWDVADALRRNAGGVVVSVLRPSASTPPRSKETASLEISTVTGTDTVTVRQLHALSFSFASAPFPVVVVVLVLVLVSDRSGSVRSAVLRPSTPSVARMHSSCC